MDTDDKKVNILLNRLLDRTGIRDDFLEFLNKKIDDTITALFAGRSGTLDLEGQTVGITSGANDTFDLDMTNADKGVVGGGQVITLPSNANRVTLEEKDIPFENDTAVIYEVGVRYQSVEDGVQVNAKTGAPEYKSFRDDFGDKGNPFSVVDDPGVKIRIVVDNILQDGATVDHAGRKAIVFMTTPVSAVESIAFFTGTVALVGTDNVVDIAYSGGAGPLGQDTTVNPPSTTAADYIVYFPGASWFAGAGSISTNQLYWFIGAITGNGPAATPTSFDMCTRATFRYCPLTRRSRHSR